MPSSCCRWRSATPWGLVLFHHHSASRIFITQPGHNLRPMVIHKDDYQPCGGEKRAGLRPPPALSFKDVHHPRWGGGQAKWGLRLSRGLAARFFLQHLGEKGVCQPCEEGELWVHGAGRLRRHQLPCVWLLGLGGFGAASGCLLPLGWGVAVRPPHRRRSRRARICHTHGFSRAADRTGGSYKTSYAAGAVVAFLDGLVLTRAARTGARTSSHVLGQPPPIGAEVVAAAGGADVVAAAGEATHCIGGCLRWRDRQCHLPPDPRLFGFNGLIVAPRRETGARTFPQRRTC
jgi:hypothetical protein